MAYMPAMQHIRRALIGNVRLYSHTPMISDGKFGWLRSEFAYHSRSQSEHDSQQQSTLSTHRPTVVSHYHAQCTWLADNDRRRPVPGTVADTPLGTNSLSHGAAAPNNRR